MHEKCLEKPSWEAFEPRVSLEGNSLSKTDIVSGVPRLIDKDMVRKSISKMRNGKAARPSGVLSEMVKATGKAGVGMITDLLNQIII